MRRNALRSFFARALLAAIPLAMGAPRTSLATDPSCNTTKIVADDRGRDGGTADGGTLDGGIAGTTPTSADCVRMCDTSDCSLTTTDAGVPAIECHVYRCGSTCGRATDGVAAPRPTEAQGLVGGYFAEMAHLEAASVHSFRRLARELRAHGAPESLVALALAAAGDEVRHARVVGRLARRHGGRPPRVEVGPLPTRSLEAVAIENAVEGCVRETYGALVASWQARAASQEQVRDALESVAIDEQRHAELAWSVAAWAESQLDSEARGRVAAACGHAVEALARDVEIEPAATLVAEAGVPTAAVARSLLASATTELWTSTAA